MLKCNLSLFQYLVMTFCWCNFSFIDDHWLKTKQYAFISTLFFLIQVPRLVEGLTGHQCSQIAAAKDHTVVLTEDGYVYTFGLNTFHQLGILPPPSNCSVPRQVKITSVKA